VARSFVHLDDDAAHALDHRSVMHGAVDLGDDRFVPRMARFEQLDDARQTTGDVLRLRRGAWDASQRIIRKTS
jgi:hypothetical protein